MRWLLEWRIKRLTKKLAKARQKEDAAFDNSSWNRHLKAVVRAAKLSCRLRDLQTEYDMYYTDRFSFHIRDRTRK